MIQAGRINGTRVLRREVEGAGGRTVVQLERAGRGVAMEGDVRACKGEGLEIM